MEPLARKLPTVFKRGTDGLVVPEIAEGQEWVQEQRTLVTIKLDGIGVRLIPAEEEQHQGKVTLQRKVGVTPDGLNQWDFVMTGSSASAEDQLMARVFKETVSCRKPGYYVIYGKDINGNPQGARDAYMTSLTPVQNMLIVNAAHHKIPQGKTVVTEAFFNAVRDELLSGDVYGIVFHWEEPVMHPVKMSQILRTDFGAPWPIPIKPLLPVGGGSGFNPADWGAEGYGGVY